MWENAQPTFRATAHGSIALGHNGNLVNTAQLAEMVADPPQAGTAARPRVGRHQRHRPAHRAARGQVDEDGKPLTIEEAACRSSPRSGAPSPSSSWTSHTLYAARDPQGIRPLVLGRLERGWVVASEVRRPRHLRRLATSARSSRASSSPSTRTACARPGSPKPKPKGCVFEYVYLARPDTDIAGRNVYRLPRARWAASWPRKHPVEADLVIATPESGTPAADRLRARPAASRSARAW